MDPKDIAILTPYNAQATEISKRLVREGITGVTVCSITKSQGEAPEGGRWASGAGGMASTASRGLTMPAWPPGSEWRYVLVSTVRTRPESDVDQRPTKGWLKKFLGFVVDPNQVNVAITRAQEGLCLIGEGCLAGAGRGWAPPWGWGCLVGEGWGLPLTPPLAGDHLLLRCCPLWRRLLDSCEAQQSLVPAGQVRVQRRPAVSF